MEIAALLSTMENSINHLSEIANLYDEFYLLKEENLISPKENEKIRKSLNFLGGFKSGFLWIYNMPAEIGGRDKEMIHNLIVNALKMSWDDIAFLNLNENSEYRFEEVLDELKPKKILIWGVNHQENKYQLTNKESYKLLYVDEIASFHDNNDLKRILWENLKQLVEG